MSGAGQRPDSAATWAREVEKRLGRLENPSAIRIGKHVIGADDSGKLVTMSPDGSTVLTPDPPPPVDINAGIMPGLFSARRIDDSSVNMQNGYNAFPGDWYDQVDFTSDRMVFDSATNTVRVESDALIAVRVQQAIRAGQAGNRQARPTVRLAYDEADTPTVVGEGQNAYYDAQKELIFADTFFIPVNAGALVSPGYWGSEFALGSFTGDPDRPITGFQIYRLLDLG